MIKTLLTALQNLINRLSLTNTLNFNIMFIHKPTNLKFENRKQAIQVMGTKRYNVALKNKEFDFNSNKKD